MRQIILSLIALIAIPFYSIAAGSEWRERASIGNFFADAKVKGCFLLFDLQENASLAFNHGRAETPFIPASTFKIFNSLVALETGAVRDQAEIIHWDGRKRKLPVWNQDHDMRSAIQNSTVWFYQELARRIGRERMQRYINLANYGNRDISGGIDQFWLDGGLRITPQQQIEFLIDLYRNKLPFSQRTMDIVKEILIEERAHGYVLRGKTGWSGAHLERLPAAPQIGWWVGYVERGSNAYFFTINIDIVKDRDAAARKDVVKGVLRHLNVIE